MRFLFSFFRFDRPHVSVHGGSEEGGLPRRRRRVGLWVLRISADLGDRLVFSIAKVGESLRISACDPPAPPLLRVAVAPGREDALHWHWCRIRIAGSSSSALSDTHHLLQSRSGLRSRRTLPFHAHVVNAGHHQRELHAAPAQPQNEPTCMLHHAATGDLHSPKRRVPTCNADRSMPMATFDADGTTCLGRWSEACKRVWTQTKAGKGQPVAEFIFDATKFRYFGPKRRISSAFDTSCELQRVATPTVIRMCNSYRIKILEKKFF